MTHLANMASAAGLWTIALVLFVVSGFASSEKVAGKDAAVTFALVVGCVFVAFMAVLAGVGEL